MDFVIHFLVAGLLFAAIDAFWIGIVANKFYKQQMKSLLRDKPAFGPAVVFYLIAIWGMVVFVIDPALAQGSWTFALSRGALFGFVCYATYDLTNASTLKNWSNTVTVVDMAWGTFVTAAVTTIAYLVL